MMVTISRIIGAFIAGIASWVAVKLPFLDFGPDEQQAVTTTLALLAYAIFHKQISKSTNPSDVAKP